MEALWQFCAAVGRVSALRPTFSDPPFQRAAGASMELPRSRRGVDGQALPLCVLDAGFIGKMRFATETPLWAGSPWSFHGSVQAGAWRCPPDRLLLTLLCSLGNLGLLAFFALLGLLALLSFLALEAMQAGRRSVHLVEVARFSDQAVFIHVDSALWCPLCEILLSR